MTVAFGEVLFVPQQSSSFRLCSMISSVQLDRRAVLNGLAGVTLALPLLEAMGQEVAAKTP